MSKAPAKNPAMVLQELTVKKCLSPPEYEIIHSVTGSHENRFDYRVRVAGVNAFGSGTSKQISKHDAAHNALLQLKDLGIYDPQENPVEEFKATAIQKAAGYASGSPLKSCLNCIAPLKDLCVENKIEDPVFIELSDVGPPHCREFTYECRIGSLRTVQTGNTKKMAKQLAAKEIMEKLKNVLPDIILEAPRVNEEQKTLAPSEKDQQVLDLYNKTFANVVVDKKVKVKNFPLVFKKLMEENEKSIEEFLDDLAEKNEDSLERLLSKIGLEYEIVRIQDNPYILVLNINCDVPFSAMALALKEEDARVELIENTFQLLNCFIKL